MKLLPFLTIIFFAAGSALIAYAFWLDSSDTTSNGFSVAPSAELVLFFNHNYLTNPPLTWEALKKELQNLNSQEGAQNLNSQEWAHNLKTQGVSGIALGRADNVRYSPEIYVILLGQQGGNLESLDSEEGLFALKFFLEFADSSKKAYTWDADRQDSLEEFKNGRLAMVIAREGDKASFKEIDFGLSPLPKIDQSQASLPFPKLNNQQKIIIKDMIEQAALGRMSPEEALTEAFQALLKIDE